MAKRETVRFDTRSWPETAAEIRDYSDTTGLPMAVILDKVWAKFKKSKRYRDYVASDTIQKASQTAGKASQARPTTKRGVRAGGAE